MPLEEPFEVKVAKSENHQSNDDDDDDDDDSGLRDEYLLKPLPKIE